MRYSTPLIFLAVIFWLAACSEDQAGAVDVRADVPVLRSTSVAPRTVNTDTINVNGERNPADLLTIPITVIASVQGTPAVVMAAVRMSENGDLLTSGALRDDGVAPDAAAGDGQFFGIIDVQFLRTFVGSLNVSVWTENALGNRSVQAITPLLIERLNRPPVISGLNAPDTVRTGSVNQFFISLRATDPDGASDIKSVVRITPSQKILFLNDAGLNGDGVAGDGIYSETVSVNPPPTPGDYLFHFRAVDRSNDSSNVLSKAIVIVQ